jgi:hypothetical protein
MENTLEVIICFESVSAAIMVENALKEQAFDIRVMPVPSGIRSGCGFCLRFSPEDIDSAAVFLSGRGFDIKEAWEREGSSGTYRKISVNLPEAHCVKSNSGV